MSSFLPNDVLLMVGGFLEDQQDRFNLIFVCRHYHDLFLRVLYRSAALTNYTATRSFLGALLRRPELARAVREVGFDGWDAPAADCADDMTVFTECAKGLSQSEEEHSEWIAALEKRAQDAWAALLLPLLPNLQQLRLMYPKENVYLDRTLQRAVKGEKPFDTQPAFRLLQQVTLNHLAAEGDKGNYRPSQVLPFFKFPSMRAISADAVLEQGSQLENEETTAEPVTRSAIDEIRLSSSNGRQGMDTLISSCAPLKSFKYQHSDSHALAEGYQPSAFYQSLAPSKNTLETLWLDYCGDHYTFTAAGLNESHDEPFGSLGDFTALKDIRIRLPNLLDIRYQAEPISPLPDVLPSSLQSLYVEGCKENNLSTLVSQLDMVLKNRQSRFPSLTRLDVEGFFHDAGDYEDSGYDEAAANAEKCIKPKVYETAETLRARCEDAGIEFYIRDRVVADTMKGSPILA